MQVYYCVMNCSVHMWGTLQDIIPLLGRGGELNYTKFRI